MGAGDPHPGHGTPPTGAATAGSGSGNDATMPRAVSYAALPGWPGEDPAAALPALLRSCLGFRGWATDRPLGGSGELARRGGLAATWLDSCVEAVALADRLHQPLQSALPDFRPSRRLSPRGQAAEARLRDAAELAWQATEAAERQALVRDLFERRFEPFAAGPGLLTGYYEPELRGAQYPSSPFLVPLHGLPPPKGEPRGDIAPILVAQAAPRLPDRTAIEFGALDGQGLEVAWVDDPVDAFFLHIQGSGRIWLHDGRLLRLGYAGQNGHPYRGIGRALIERGLIPREGMSMQAIRAWLAAAAPGDAAAVLRQNPSYVFFRRLEGLRPDQGPPGAMGVPLTPGRSLAVDPAFMPYGAPVFVVTRDPLDGSPLHRLLLAQDTGGAIRGQGRGDVFWGWGHAAAARAGRMHERAEVFVLVPREPERADKREILAVEEMMPLSASTAGDE